MFVQPEQMHNSDKMPIVLPPASVAANSLLAAALLSYVNAISINISTSSFGLLKNGE